MTTKPVAAFVALLHRAEAKLTSSFWRYCDTCGAERQQVLVAETKTQEIYKCEACGLHRVYTVR